MRLKIKQARPVNLNDAVRHAVELEAFYRAESRQTGQGFIEAAARNESSDDGKWNQALSSLRNTMEEMTKSMNKFMSQQQRNVNNRRERNTYHQGRDHSKQVTRQQTSVKSHPDVTFATQIIKGAVLNEKITLKIARTKQVP